MRYDAPCTEETVIRAVEEAGYHVAEGPQRRSSGLYLLAILLGLFVIARQLGWTDFFSDSRRSVKRRSAMQLCFWWDF